MAKKTNMKSIRLSDEVLEYIENFEGNGFNQKFENLVLFCMKEEDQKRKRIKDLDCLIQLEFNKFNAVTALQRDARFVNQRLLSVQHDLEKLQTYVNTILAPDDLVNPADS